MSVHRSLFFSNVLQMNTAIQVILPEQKIDNKTALYKSSKKFPVLWLLHGLSDDETSFIRLTSIERYANDHGLAVVMPRMERSFYSDMVYGPKYWTYMTEELPKRARMFFPLSDLPQANFVAGNSMGGYGALKWALRRPTDFSAVGILSGVMDVNNFGESYSKLMPDFKFVFGKDEKVKKNQDLTWLLQHISEKNVTKLKVFQTVGKDDFLYNQNQEMRSQLANTFKKNYLYVEKPGIHDWNFWDKQIEAFIEWLPIDKELNKSE